MGNLLLRQWPVSLDQSGQNDQQSGQDLFWMALLGWTAADAGCLGPHLLTWLQGPVSVLSPVLLPLWTGTRRACQQNMLWVQGTCAENHKHHPQTGPVITVACLTNITCYDTIFFYSFLIIQIHTNIQTSKSTGVLRPVNRCGYIRTKIYRRTDRQKDKRAKERQETARMNHFQNASLILCNGLLCYNTLLITFFLSELLMLCFVCAYNYINKVFIQRTVLYRKTILSACTHTQAPAYVTLYMQTQIHTVLQG